MTARIALVNMPFAMADRPSIQCGLLKAALRDRGHQAEVFYLNLELAAELGAPVYNDLALLRSDQLVGEWLFSAAAFGPGEGEEAYRAACPQVDATCRRLGIDFARLCRLRNEELPAWVERWAGGVGWDAYQAVGFTSTFEQNNAVFALAHRIKRRHPQVAIILGGANCDGDMGKEYLRGLPFIDYVVAGEGERPLVAMAERLARKQCALGIPGVAGRRHGMVAATAPAAVTTDMDALPDPDYDEYFEALFRLGCERVLGDAPPLLLIESSRGCWWGEKQHCTFCGLNANNMGFRAKSPEATLGQLERLSSRYRIARFEAVDNIMDFKYLEGLCRPLSEKRYDFELFYEVKANLTSAQLRTMASAGITTIQPGIESLNSHILRLMRKGVTMLRNVRLLKWAYYHGMKVRWNLLTGFPGETPEDYAQQLNTVLLLRHLPPPDGCGPIWLERFSPYFFDESFPVKDRRPLDAYRFVYPGEQLDLEQVAYFFAYRMEDTVPFGHHEELLAQVAAWRSAWFGGPRPALVYQRAPGWLQVVDRRDPAALKAHAFESLAAEIYEHCGETDRTVAALLQHLAGSSGRAVAEQEVRSALERFCGLGLMLAEEERFLSLALPSNPNW